MIELKNVYKTYETGGTGVQALDGVSLRIEKGEFVSIMGPSGSGKSTLMHIIGLLDKPDSGTLSISGKQVMHLTDDELAVLRRGTIGFVFQQFNLLPRLSALENVMLPLVYSKEEADSKKAEDLLKRLGLGDRMRHVPNQLSIGQQQRVAIARALINSPEMILADEPTGNLDTTRANETMGILKELNARGITVVIVTHEEDIGRQARRMIRIRDGRVVEDVRISGKGGEPAARPDHYVRAGDRRENEQGGILGFLHPAELWDFFKEGFRSLKVNKFRTGLSMLGILIGVAAVMAMLALGRGAKEDIQQQLSSLGSNLLMLRPGIVRSSGAALETGASTRLSIDDVKNIEGRLPYVADAAGVVMSRGQITFMNKNWNTQVMGVEPVYEAMHDSKPVVGRFFTEAEDRSRGLVALVGMTIVKEIFGGQNPVGEMIKLNKVNFRVVGVMPSKGGGGWRDRDDVVVIPLQTAMHRLIGNQYLDYIDIEVADSSKTDQAEDDIMDLMVSTHRVPVSQRDDAFQVWNMADIQAILTASTQTMSMLLATIAAISLVVGGIGIMNIMFVSVMERTREIGLRKAVGAQKSDILAQFLAESVVISAVGGIMGIATGIFLIKLVALVAKWNTIVSVPSILLAMIFSCVVGMGFGIYPARKASLLNPIDALRYE
jgi:macrolide transport system ATP-binding/permease protein